MIRDMRYATLGCMAVDQQYARQLDSAARAFRRAENVLNQRRVALHEAVRAAVGAGMSKSEAGRRAGYTREYVAEILKIADSPRS